MLEKLRLPIYLLLWFVFLSGASLFGIYIAPSLPVWATIILSIGGLVLFVGILIKWME